MSESKELSPAQKLIGDFAPKLAELTDEVLFGDVWARTELSPRDRSLVTVAALIANGNTEQLVGHLNRAKANGLTETELAEVIIHLAFYAGWPRSMSAIRVARDVFKRYDHELLDGLAFVQAQQDQGVQPEGARDLSYLP